MKTRRVKARTVAGGGIFILSVTVLVMLYQKPELSDNDLFNTLAQAIIVQGLVGLALAFFFTDKERSDPEPVEVINSPRNPVPVENEDDPLGNWRRKQ